MKRTGYTLIELLVVIVIGALLVGIAIPAFQALLTSSRESLAQNSLQQAILSARDAASANIGGGDTAAVFFYDPNRGITVGIYEKIGSLSDDSDNDAGSALRDVFVPISSMEPVQLPPDYSVRGFVLGTQLRDEDWYEELIDYSPGTGLQPGGNTASDRGPGAWVFPETDFYDKLEQDDGADRQTFMIRFTAGTGTLSRDNTSSLILDPRPSNLNRSTPAAIQPIDQAEDLRAWTVRALISTGLTSVELRQLLGNESGDTVLARPVSDIALYRERRLGQMLQVRNLNRDTNSIYLKGKDPEVDSSLFRDSQLASDRVELETRITQWLEGRLALERTQDAGSALEADSAVYTVGSYFGELVEVVR
ncbi:MAG: prepilin-type N-terminal cleavage/methylation domain-containing protein [Phycisphaerales bacterium]|nr:prepilin-type N-terminal cleavage/methylation domain-containing protein [Phycisphaerales bacterium]MCB9837276.1 prepilin-type N-terminal cleavage/methylation domain-containing protein [Phycisphaera sp.]